jgi:hypothetical protein
MRGFALILGLLALPARAEDPHLIRADAAGVLDLAAAQQAETFDELPNPFRDRYRPAAPVREVTLTIRAVAVPARPEAAAVLINGRLYSPGDTWEGLSLTRIDPDMLELSAEGFLLQVPVENRPATVRLLTR